MYNILVITKLKLDKSLKMWYNVYVVERGYSFGVHNDQRGS